MKDKLKKISEYEWKLEKTGKMLVPGVIFASEKLMQAVEPEAIQQLANVATLKGIQKHALAMPDMHSGLLLS
ncbi:MAG: RtcB family protein [Candidatus Nanoarchaeia archaeon]|nr:RtcB family protein [Candidatus Nanoarchaeia archaeon]